jgi:hypothetical protein
MNHEDLSSRLDSVERENRRLKRAGAVALGFVGAALLAAQWAPVRGRSLVEAGGFALGDGSGRTLALLSSSPDGAPFLVLYDEAGAPRGTLSMSMAGPSCLSFRDRDGQVRWTLPCQTGDTPPASGRPAVPPRPTGRSERWLSLLIAPS